MVSNVSRSMRLVLPGALAFLVQICHAQSPADFQHWRLPASVPHPADNQPSPERTELGKMLFFDTRLSGNGSLSCYSCHMPELGWSDGKAVSIGMNGKPMARNSPSLINGAYNTGPTMWGGQKKSLEDQVSGPVGNPDIMATDIPKLLKTLNETPGYKARFDKAYPGEAIDMSTVAKALANFERTIISRDSKFDQWLDGKAMTAQQLRGLTVFTGKATCSVCHMPPFFTDNGFHNIGMASKDSGRHKVKPLPALQGAFKTPQLRDTAYKAPYMHDGSLKTLMDVVEHYNKGGDTPGVGTVSPLIKPLNLSQTEKEDLVAFLHALSGPLQKMSAPTLP
jgi:cytochrome c peroxidase